MHERYPLRSHVTNAERAGHPVLVRRLCEPLAVERMSWAAFNLVGHRCENPPRLLAQRDHQRRSRGHQLLSEPLAVLRSRQVDKVGDGRTQRERG